jgi:hypothetical protein
MVPHIVVMRYTCGMPGKRTSVYLSEELDAAVKASGVPIADLIRRGLEAGTPADVAVQLAAIRADIAILLEAQRGGALATCPHRLAPGAYCKTCERSKT